MTTEKSCKITRTPEEGPSLFTGNYMHDSAITQTEKIAEAVCFILHKLLRKTEKFTK